MVQTEVVDLDDSVFIAGAFSRGIPQQFFHNVYEAGIISWKGFKISPILILFISRTEGGI